MRNISNADYDMILRLLDALSRISGGTVREKENARKSSLLLRKLKKKDGRYNTAIDH